MREQDVRCLQKLLEEIVHAAADIATDPHDSNVAEDGANHILAVGSQALIVVHRLTSRSSARAAGAVKMETTRFSGEAMSRRVKVLIVEDDAELRRMFRHALALGGMEVQEAADGLHALRLLDGSTPPDAVILDLGLPMLNGYVVRQELAAHAHLRQIPVVVVTGEPGPHEHLNVACILYKPVAPERLVTTVRSCIASGSTSLT